MTARTLDFYCSRAALALREAALGWLRSDALTWIHVAKTVAASLIAMGIAMRLELPQPRTAMATVFIVMQPQSGLVLAKSFYRFVGTLVGSVVTIAITAVFGQQPELFLLSVALWIGVCTVGAARNRNFRSYAFVLSGYTAALVGLPASTHPEGVFLAAMTRVSEVWLGIACAGAISALILPQRTADALREGVRARYQKFARFVAGALDGSIDQQGIEQTNARIIADVIGLEAMRSAAVFEDWGVRRRAGRITRLNNEFMQVSTRFYALHQLANRIRASGGHQVSEAIDALCRDISPLLTKTDGDPVRTAADAEQAAAKLHALKSALPARLQASRAALDSRTDADLLDFDTAGDLLYRFIDEMHAYTLTYASLAVEAHEREQPEPGYIARTNLTAAGVAGLRAAIAMLLMSAFWLATAWPSGGTAVLNTAVNCALVATMPWPAKAAFQMTIGTALAAVVGMGVMFGIYPHIDGYLLLCVSLAPVLLAATLVTLRHAWGGVGLGFCISLCILAGPDNLIQYDPAQFIDNAFALVVSMIVVTLASAVIMPPDLPWLHRRLHRELLQLVVVACTGRRGALARLRLESAARDLMNQASGVAVQRPQIQQEMLAWMLVVLEIGLAALDLRAELAAQTQVASRESWSAAAQRVLEKLATLFSAPSPQRTADAKEATAAVVEMLLAAHNLDATPEQRNRSQRVLSALHFIQGTLLDPQSPLNHDTGAPA